jgi:thiosulfate/3-mercaptopyruvate sulfurtransferase
MRHIFSLALVFMATFSIFSLTPDVASATSWFVDANQAKELLDGGAIVLDARGKLAYRAEHIEGAQPASWQEFSKSSKSARGNLLSAKVIQAKLRAKGVSNDTPVLVVGDPKKGWGEDGRIVWMLRTMGHAKASVVDGGHAALVKAGAKTTSGGADKIVPGDFEAKVTRRYAASEAQIREELKKEKRAVFVDTREAREYAGKTPYGEARGGHVPGAVHLHFSDLYGADGKLLPRDKIEAKLKSLGIESKDQAIIAYCTGGIRSGFFVAVLQELGYRNAKNYAGSMWEWSSMDPETHPLEK